MTAGVVKDDGGGPPPCGIECAREGQLTMLSRCRLLATKKPEWRTAIVLIGIIDTAFLEIDTLTALKPSDGSWKVKDCNNRVR